MSKRFHFLIAITVAVSVLVTVVAHACSDLNSLQAIRQTPCDHNTTREGSGGKHQKDNCDSIRYGMLSKEASFAATELSKVYSTPLHTVLVIFSLPDSLPSFWRSQGPPFVGLGTLPQLSHVILRI